MLYKIDLRPEIRNRNIFVSEIYNQTEKKTKPKIHTLIDTGAANTMLDINLAKQYGNKLNITEPIVIAGYTAIATGYVMPKIVLDGKMTIQRIFVWGFPFENNWLDGFLILGLNTLNNWRYLIDKSDNSFSIEENFPHDLLYKHNPYYNRFSKGNYVAFQDDLQNT
ncbi:MAG: hypothetical protein FWG64_03635 [Firmicutes bacterium]|nr:hypothetical protein [Bacillota bacterium]